jgi:hypothetical protein
MTGSKRNGPIRGLTLYFVLVFLLAWAPWNGWLIAFGGALYWGLYRTKQFTGRNVDTGIPEIVRKIAGGDI